MMIWAGCWCNGDRYKAERGDNRGIPWDVTTQLFSWETSVIVCHLLSLFFGLSGMEPQRDKATCQDCTVQKGQMLDSVPGALLATSQPVLKALSIRTTQGFVR